MKLIAYAAVIASLLVLGACSSTTQIPSATAENSQDAAAEKPADKSQNRQHEFLGGRHAL